MEVSLCIRFIEMQWRRWQNMLRIGGKISMNNRKKNWLGLAKKDEKDGEMLLKNEDFRRVLYGK